MAKRPNQKLKLLYIYKILLEQTDAENGLTLKQLSDELSKYGIYAERKTLYDDIEALKLFGVDIDVRRDRYVRYCVATRELSLEELKLMADAVNDASFMSPKEKEQTFRRLVRLGGKSSASLLRLRDSENDGREMTRSNCVAVVCRAIAQNRKISCRCFSYNSQKQRIMQFEGRTLSLSPWYIELAPSPRFVAYDHAAKQMRVLFADRLLNVEMLNTSREGESEYSALVESGELDVLLGHPRRTVIRLRCDASVADELIRKFGLDATFTGSEGDSFEASVRTSPDLQLFSWIFSMAGKVQILSPESALSEYKKLLDDQYK